MNLEPSEILQTIPATAIAKVRDALTIGLEHTQDRLIHHDTSLGRTTRSNRHLGEMLEQDVVSIEDAIRSLMQPYEVSAPRPDTRKCPECGHAMHKDVNPLITESPDITVWKCHCGLNMSERLVIGPGVKDLMVRKP